MTTTPITTTGKKGDLRIAFGFKRVPHYGPQPVVYLFRAAAPQLMVDIPTTHISRFDERDRDPITKEPLCMPLCEEIADAIYGMRTMDGARRVLDTISEWMTDIKNLPPPATFRDSSHMLDEMKRRGFDLVEEG